MSIFPKIKRKMINMIKSSYRSIAQIVHVRKITNVPLKKIQQKQTCNTRIYIFFPTDFTSYFFLRILRVIKITCSCHLNKTTNAKFRLTTKNMQNIFLKPKINIRVKKECLFFPKFKIKNTRKCY